MTDTRRIASLLSFKVPKAETVVVQHEDRSVQAMTVSQYERFFNVKMTQGIVYDAGYQFVIDSLQKNIREMKDEINKEYAGWVANFIKTPKNYFGVAYMTKTIQYGAVALEDIPAGTLIQIYGGEIAVQPREGTYPPDEDRIYNMSLSASYLQSVKARNEWFTLCISAKYYSNLTRFSPHLPNLDEVKKMVANGELEASIAANVLTENIDYGITIYNDAPLNFFRTMTFVPKWGILGIDYGSGYWSNKPRPCLLIQEDDGVRVAVFNSELKKYVLTDDVIRINLSNPQTKPLDYSWLFAKEHIANAMPRLKPKTIDAFQGKKKIVFSIKPMPKNAANTDVNFTKQFGLRQRKV